MEQITQDNYRKYPAINYSKLSALDVHPSKVLEEKEKEAGMIKGDILDLLCFSPEKIYDKYYISSLEKLPTDAIKAIIEESPSFEDKDLIETARRLNFGAPNWKDQTILDKILVDGEDYIQVLQESDGKEIVSLLDFEELKRAKQLLYNNEYTERFFKNSEFQKPFVTNIEHLDGEALAKCLMDIYQELTHRIVIADLKFTSSPIMNFPYDFINWRYYLQSSLYSDIVESVTGKPASFYFVVYSAYDRKVLSFLVSNRTRVAGREGGLKRNGNSFKGYRQLMTEYIWHKETDLWDFPYQVYESNGTMELDVFK